MSALARPCEQHVTDYRRPSLTSAVLLTYVAVHENIFHGSSICHAFIKRHFQLAVVCQLYCLCLLLREATR